MAFKGAIQRWRLIRARKLIVGTATDYLRFDPSNKLVSILNTQAGGDSPRALRVDAVVLAGNAGYRQGAIAVSVGRAVGQDIAGIWDGNPDCAIKGSASNYAANADNVGAIRVLDLSARNRGTNISWINGASIGARNDSGKTAYQVIGIQARVENYGTLKTEAIGLDVNLSIESDTGSPLKYGIRVRNTDQSGMAAADAAIHVSHTSTNGFSHFVHFAANAGDGVVANAVTPSGATVEALVVKVGNNTRYIPIYAALAMN